MDKFLNIKENIVIDDGSKSGQVKRTQCPHKIAQLGSRQDCDQSAMMCREKCQRRTNPIHWQSHHKFYSAEKLKSYISQNTQQLNSDVYTIKSAIIYVFEQNQKQLKKLQQTFISEIDFLIKQVINLQNTQFVRNSILKLEDQRSELLSCRQVHCLRNFHPKISIQNNQIIEDIQNDVYVQISEILSFLHQKQAILCNKIFYRAINHFSNKQQKNLEKTQKLQYLPSICSNHVKIRETYANPNNNNMVEQKNEEVKQNKLVLQSKISQQIHKNVPQSNNQDIKLRQQKTQQLKSPVPQKNSQNGQINPKRQQKTQQLKSPIPQKNNYKNQMLKQKQHKSQTKESFLLNARKQKYMDIQDSIIPPSDLNCQKIVKNKELSKQGINEFSSLCCKFLQTQSIDKLFNEQRRDVIQIQKEKSDSHIQPSIKPNKQSPFENSAKIQNNSIFNKMKGKENSNLDDDSCNPHNQGRKMIKLDTLDFFITHNSKKQQNKKKHLQNNQLSKQNLIYNHDKQVNKLERNIANGMKPEMPVKQRQSQKDNSITKARNQITVQFINKVRNQEGSKKIFPKMDMQMTNQRQQTDNSNKRQKFKGVECLADNHKNVEKQENTKKELLLQNSDKKYENNTEKSLFLKQRGQKQSSNINNNTGQKSKPNTLQIIKQDSKQSQRMYEKSADKKIKNPFKNSLSIGKVISREYLQQLTKKLFQDQERKKMKDTQKQKESNKKSSYNQLSIKLQAGVPFIKLEQEQMNFSHKRYQDKDYLYENQMKNEQNKSKNQKQQISVSSNKQNEGFNRNLNFNNKQYKSQMPKYLNQEKR